MEKKRWAYLGTGTVVLLFLGLIYAWSISRAPISETFTSWSVSQISMTFTISMIFFCLGGFLGGKLFGKTGPKLIFIAAAISLLVGFLGASTISPNAPGRSLMMLYIFYGIFAGGGVGLAYNAVLSSVIGWFGDKSGLASGILLLGFGFGGMVLGSAVQAMIGNIGLNMTFRVLGIAIMIIVLLAAIVIKAPNNKVVEDTSEDVKNYTASEMAKTKTFWIFLVWLILVNSAGLMIINSAASIALAFGASSVVGLIVSVFNGVGRVFTGAIFDKFGRKTAMGVLIITVLLAGASLSAGAATTAIVLIVCGLSFAGLGYGGNPTLVSAVAHGLYGPKYYSVNLSVMNFSLIPAAIIGPLTSSALIDSSGGSYNTTFYVYLAFGLASIVLFVLLNKFIKQVRDE